MAGNTHVPRSHLCHAVHGRREPRYCYRAGSSGLAIQPGRGGDRCRRGAEISLEITSDITRHLDGCSASWIPMEAAACCPEPGCEAETSAMRRSAAVPITHTPPSGTALLHRRRRHRRGPQGLSLPHRIRAQRGRAARKANGATRCLAHDPPASGRGRNSRADRQSQFRATGITAYPANDGTLEHAQEMAAHESPRTTKLYDRTKDRLTQKDGISADNGAKAVTPATVGTRRARRVRQIGVHTPRRTAQAGGRVAGLSGS